MGKGWYYYCGNCGCRPHAGKVCPSCRRNRERKDPCAQYKQALYVAPGRQGPA